jgi:ABC-type spermidine/putrescine transport system permease subunit II
MSTARLSGLGRLLGLAVVTVFLVAPTVLVVLISFGKDPVIRWPPDLGTFGWYAELVRDGAWMAAIGRSVALGLLSAVGAMAVGSMASFGLVRGDLPFRRAIEVLAIGPMIVPPVVLATGGYSFYADLGLVGSFFGLVLLHTVLGVPFVVLTVSAALARTDPNLELASAGLGANRLTTFRRVTLPLIMPAALSGGLFAFLTSFDEVIISTFIIRGAGSTLPVRIFSSLTTGLTPVVAAISTLQVVVAVAALGAMGALSHLQRKRTAGELASA